MIGEIFAAVVHGAQAVGATFLILLILYVYLFTDHWRGPR